MGAGTRVVEHGIYEVTYKGGTRYKALAWKNFDTLDQARQWRSQRVEKPKAPKTVRSVSISFTRAFLRKLDAARGVKPRPWFIEESIGDGLYSVRLCRTQAPRKRLAMTFRTTFLQAVDLMRGSTPRGIYIEHLLTPKLST